MQGAEHQVAGFRCGNGQFDGFQVTHFANQDQIGVFTQGCLECRREGARMTADLPLVDQALLAGMDELDRILDSQYVFLAGPVDMIDHRRQGC